MGEEKMIVQQLQQPKLMGEMKRRRIMIAVVT